ncbi:unnamed protein product [Urochloa humidicola]
MGRALVRRRKNGGSWRLPPTRRGGGRCSPSRRRYLALKVTAAFGMGRRCYPASPGPGTDGLGMGIRFAARRGGGGREAAGGRGSTSIHGSEQFTCDRLFHVVNPSTLLDDGIFSVVACRFLQWNAWMITKEIGTAKWRSCLDEWRNFMRW